MGLHHKGPVVKLRPLVTAAGNPGRSGAFRSSQVGRCSGPRLARSCTHLAMLWTGRGVGCKCMLGVRVTNAQLSCYSLSPLLPSPNAGGAFFRPESCAGRDLAVLAAALHKRRTGRLRVLEACCGSGMRGARYLAQASAIALILPDPPCFATDC